MIVELSVENFRSIRAKQTFSLYAESPGTHLLSNIAELPDSGSINILKSVGVYGANASGKSNLLLAFAALKYLVVRSGDLKDGDQILCYEPFLLSKKGKKKPVRFEMEFVLPSGVRYRYRVAFLKRKVVEERLSMFKTTKESLLFERLEPDSWETVKFGALYKGGTKRLPFFENQTYLSKAGNSADAPKMIRDVYNFLRRDIVHLGPDGRGDFSDLPSHVLKKVAILLSFADTGISGIVRKKVDVDEVEFKFPADLPDEIRERLLRELRQEYHFSHRTESGAVEQFTRDMESAGTVRMFHLAPLVIDALETGGVLIIDELDNSMHSFMAELVIRLFNDPDVNSGRAQLIFTTHNINLMSPQLLRRDQIWFSEKGDGASRFYTLDDFDKKKVTPTSPFSRWYAEGRFGAVPRIYYQSIAEQLRAERADAEA